MNDLHTRIEKLTSEISKWENIQQTTTDIWMRDYCTPFLESLKEKLEVLENTRQSLEIAKSTKYVN